MAARQAELSVKVIANAPSTVAPAAAVKVGAGGLGMLNVLDVMDVKEPDVNVIVAPVTLLREVAVNPAKVAVPLAAVTVVVPSMVHVPAPTAAVTEFVLVVVFPY